MKRILVVGDIIFDKYNFVTSERMAPEAPIPVWDNVRSEMRPGGAANVAANIRSIADSVMPKECSVWLLGIVDKSGHGRELTHLHGHGVNLMFLSHGHSMIKERFVHNERILFRYDNDRKFCEDDVKYFEKDILGFEFRNKFDAVVFSDYDKGTLTEKVVNHCRSISGLAVVDSKREDLSMYSGCNILKLNELEYSKQVALGASSETHQPIEMKFQNVVVTKGSRGADLRQFARASYDAEMKTVSYETISEEFPGENVNQVDVTGCGDTHTAAMVVSLLKDRDPRLAVKFANERAAQVVQKFGTSVAR